MAFCNNCGSELFYESDTFCSACGTRIQKTDTQPEDITHQGQTSESEDASVIEEHAHQNMIEQNAPAYPDTSAQKLFSIIMIVICVFLFCCGGSVSLAFAILGLVFVLVSEKAPDVDTANKRLRTALVMNCISVGMLVLGALFSFAFDILYLIYSLFS